MAHFLIPSLVQNTAEDSVAEKSAHLFIERMARAVGLTAVKDASLTPSEDNSLRTLLVDIQKLKDADVASSWGRTTPLPDEPRTREWWVGAGGSKCGGLSVNSDYDALRAVVSEALERHIWARENDYFDNAITASFSDLGQRAIDPFTFAGYSAAQRLSNPRLSMSHDTPFLWINGYSLVHERLSLIPAQIVSGLRPKETPTEKKEPRIRERITTGLATHSTKTEALLGGALEVIERDAFMIMWLNKLSLPVMSHDDMVRDNPALKELLARCARYQLSVHFVKLITDAPAHVIMAVVRDPRMLTPIEVGLSSHTRCSGAAEKALLEALRARRNARERVRAQAGKPFTKKASEINFGERHLYWADPSRVSSLDFLTSGEETPLKKSVWDNDSPSEHLKRITNWCSAAEYECIYADLGRSKKNVLGLDVVFVVIPELQPLYLNEARRYEGGERLKGVPKKFGYTPRESLFTDVPHPFV